VLGDGVRGWTKRSWVTTLLLVGAALLSTGAVTRDGLPALGGSNVLRGSEPASIEVVLEEAARFTRPKLVDERVFTVSGDRARAAGFVIESVDDPQQVIVAVQHPTGWGYDGGIDQQVFTPHSQDVVLAPGRYRVWLLTEAGVEVEVAFALEGLPAEATLHPTEPAGFELTRGDERYATGAGRVLRQTGTHAPLAGGGWIVSGVSFLGDPGTAGAMNLCVLFGGPEQDEAAYAAPVCVPRTAFSGRDGMVQLGPGAFAPIGPGGSMAFYTLVTARPGAEYGLNHTLGFAGEPTEAHLGTLWISRGSGL
jgi:hypothetical protein